ncbi:MAG: hypothetical protein ACFCD0_23615 [Gemmataceae bacterium]
MNFDPYHKWLGISKKHRPPTYYHLLGIAPDETDVDVIEEAAIRQTTHLRSYQRGPHSELCTRLLNEVAEARQTLLDPRRRHAYDAELARRQTSIGTRPAYPSPVTAHPPDPFAGLDAVPSAPPRRGPSARPRANYQKRNRSSTGALILYVGIGVLALLLIIGVAVLIVVRRGAGNREDKRPEGLPKKRKVEPPPKKKPLTLLDQLDPDQIPLGDRLANVPELVAVCPGGKGQLWAVAFSPDGSLLAAGGNHAEVFVWTIEGNRPTLHCSFRTTGGIPCIDFSPDGKSVVMAPSNGVEVWDVTGPKGSLVTALGLPGQGWGPVHTAKNGQFAFGNRNGPRLVNKIRDPLVIRDLGPRERIRAIQLSEDGKRLAWSTRSQVEIWDVVGPNPQRAHVIPCPREAMKIDFSDDGKFVAFGCQAGIVHVWDFTEGGVKKRFEKKMVDQLANSVDIAPDGKRMLVTEGGYRLAKGKVLWVRTEDGQVLREWVMPERCATGVLSPDGRYAAIGCHNEKVYIIRLPQGREE